MPAQLNTSDGPAEVARRAVDRGADRLGVGHVDLVRPGGAARCGDLGRGLVDRVGHDVEARDGRASAASCCAVARPSPDPAPVTIATRPSNRPICLRSSLVALAARPAGESNAPSDSGSADGLLGIGHMNTITARPTAPRGRRHHPRPARTAQRDHLRARRRAARRARRARPRQRLPRRRAHRCRAAGSAPASTSRTIGPSSRSAGLEGARAGMRSQAHIAALVPHLRRIQQPVIAAVNGPAYGGGLRARVWLRHPRRGRSRRACACSSSRSASAAATSASATRCRASSACRARRSDPHRRVIDAAEAERIGLVSRSCPTATR